MASNRTRANRPGTAHKGGGAGPLLHVTRGGIGVDYSRPVRTLLVSPDGTSELSKADVIAIAYGFQKHEELGRLPCASLVCRNVIAARKAWEIFEAWQGKTDGDAVRLSWVFNSEGYYRLIVAEDDVRLRVRLRGFDASNDEIVLSGVFVKRFESISKPTEDFRAYLRNWYSPFFFVACTDTMTPIGSPLLKFRATQADESALEPGSFERVYLGLERPATGTPGSDVDGEAWRAGVLKTHFPVTMARLSRSDVAPLLEEATALGFERWQIQQGAANLALSNDLSPGRPHFSGLQRSSAANTIAGGVSARHEMADSFDFPKLLADGRLVKQLLLDASALLRSVGQQTTSSPVHAVTKLRKAGLLGIAPRRA
jgi:hypothetical protein